MFVQYSMFKTYIQYIFACTPTGDKMFLILTYYKMFAYFKTSDVYSYLKYFSTIFSLCSHTAVQGYSSKSLPSMLSRLLTF